MNLDPFSGLNPSTPNIFQRPRSGGISRPKKPEAAPAEEDAAPADSGEDEAEEEAAEEQATEKAVLSNPKWDVEDVGFNEETPVSVEAKVPEAKAHKTKVAFELFAKTPDGPESVSKGEGTIKDGKAVCKIPVYFPEYKDDEGNMLPEVEYYFSAKHSDSDLLKDDTVVKKVDHLADRLIQSHVLEDVTFATDKSFISPKHAPTLKAMVKKMAEWKKTYPDGKMAIFGHTDAVGKEDYNKKLSERRADSVYALLTKDPDLWKALYDEEKWGLASTQELLNHLGHDAGTVDGQDGPKTQGAVKSFQKSKGMAESGQADAATREALYDAFFADCNSEIFVTKDFDAIDGKPRTGCGEFNLVENTQGACAKNRRVAILLLKSNKNFPIQYPCKHGDIAPCKKQKERKGSRRTAGFSCLFYDQLVAQENKGDGPVPAGGKVKRFVHSAEKEIKRIVNLTGKPDLGPEFAMEVEVEAGVTKVFWKATAAKENSKRNDPVPGFVDPGTKKPVALKDGVGEFEAEVKDGKAQAVFNLGLAGGDVFTLEAAAEKGKKELEQKVTTTRKVWTQITLEKGLVLPALPNFFNAYELVGVNVVRTKDVEFEKKDAPARTFYPEWMASPGGAEKEVAVIGSHNKAHFQGLLKDVADENPKVHMVICQQQFDEGEASAAITSNLSSRLSAELSASVPLFNPALKGNLVLTGKWKSLAPAGHPDHGKSGILTDSDIILEKGRSDRDKFKVKLPASAVEPSATSKVQVEVKLQGANGPFLGESDGKQILAVYDPADPTDFQNTLTHEMGHAYNQTPGSGSQSPGLEKHPHHYVKHGGQGPHCSTILTDGKETIGVEVDIPDPDNEGKTMKGYLTGVCVMFHSGPQPGCLNRYCDTCLPYVKATDFSDFGKP